MTHLEHGSPPSDVDTAIAQWALWYDNLHYATRIGIPSCVQDVIALSLQEAEQKLMQRVSSQEYLNLVAEMDMQLWIKDFYLECPKLA